MSDEIEVQTPQDSHEAAPSVTPDVPAAPPASPFVVEAPVEEPTVGTQQSGIPTLSRAPVLVSDAPHPPYEGAFVVADCQRGASNFCHWQGSYCPSCNTYTTNTGDTLRGIAEQVWGAGNDLWKQVALVNAEVTTADDGVEDLALVPGTKLRLP